MSRTNFESKGCLLLASVCLMILMSLEGCSSDAPREHVSDPTRELPVQPSESKSPAGEGSQGQAAAGTKRIAISPDLDRFEARLVRNFVRFAEAPSAATAAAVNFDPDGVLVATQDRAVRRLGISELSRVKNWSVVFSDPGGTTSALFVLENTLRKARDSVARVALKGSSRRTAVCSQPVTEPGALSGLATASIVPAESISCAMAFRVDLFFKNGLVVGVGLDVGTL